MAIKMHNGRGGVFRFSWPERHLKGKSLYTRDPAEAKRRFKELTDRTIGPRDFDLKYRGTLEAAKVETPAEPPQSEREGWVKPPLNSPGDLPRGDSEPLTIESAMEQVAAQRASTDGGPAFERVSLDDDGPDFGDSAERAPSAESDNGPSFDYGAPGTSDTPPRKPRGKYSKLSKEIAETFMGLNVVAAGVAVHLFGRKPKDPEQIAGMEQLHGLMTEAWKEKVDEWLEGQDVNPWVVIGGGTAIMGFAMFMQGEKLPKKGAKKPEGETVGPSGEAPQ